MGLITTLLVVASTAIAGKKVGEKMIDKKTESAKQLKKIDLQNTKEIKTIDHLNTKDIMYSKHMQDKDIKILEHNLAHNKNVPTLKHCTHCGANNEQEARFCYNCGHEISFNALKISKYCSSCGHALIGEKGFTVKCEYCGNEQIL